MIEGLWRSCYDFNWLLERKDDRASRAAAYVALLALVLTAGRMAAWGPATVRLVDKTAAFVRGEMPEVRVEKGKVSVDGPQPWSREFLDGQFEVVLDTAGARGLDAAKPMGLLVGDDSLTYKSGPDASQALPLKPVESFSTRGPEMDTLAARVRDWVYPVLGVFTGLGTLTALVFRWLLTAALGTVLASAMGSPLGWSELLRISAFAATPAVYALLLGALTPLRVLLIPTLAHLAFVGITLWASRPQEPTGEAAENGYKDPDGSDDF